MKDPFRELLAFLRRLDDAKIHYELRQSREEAIMVCINVPGERWEVEFVDYGDEVHIEVERFKSNGHMDDESALDELFAKYSDAEPSTGDPADANEATARK
jgi:hypothetical protein